LARFKRDIKSLLRSLCKGMRPNHQRKLRELGDKLIQLNAERLVKINHSVLELLCAKHLICCSYDVDVERAADTLSCDVYATKGPGNLIVEIETGYVPPEHALDPSTYCKARIASKIARYSNHAGKFALATPTHYVMWIHEALTKPPRERTTQDLNGIKSLCDSYYTNPPVKTDEIRNARLHAVYILNVDKSQVEEMDPHSYLERTQHLAY
jgi:hypothetical protein